MLSGVQKANSGAGSGADVSDLELLAHYELESESGKTRSGFAMILELTERRLLLETDVPFTQGDTLRLNFFLPDPGASAVRTKIGLRCLVGQCVDAEKLHYSARVGEIGDVARNAVRSLREARGVGEDG